VKQRILIVLLLWFSIIFSAEMVVTKELIKEPGDLTLRQSPRRDHSGNYCALIKINTNLMPFDKIESNLTPVAVENKTGEVWVYLSPGEKRLYLDKTGFARLIYDIKLQLESNSVYSLTIRESGAIPSIENVVLLTFNLNQEEVVISREGKAPIIARSTVAPFRLPPGKYSFTFQKEGFQTQTQEIILQNDASYDINMQPGSSRVSFSAPGILTIDSNPSSSEVELNGQKVGVTPYQGSHYAGEYTITLRKDLYHPASRTFTLHPGETLEVPLELLKPRFGYLKVSTTPGSADIYLDEKLLGKSPIKKQIIPSGDHVLRIALDKYKTHQLNFTVQDGEEPDINIDLEPNFARMEINSAPVTGASVLIDGIYAGTTPYIEPMMPAGSYTISVEKELWSGTSETIIIEPQMPFTRTLVLTKDFGTLSISAPGSTIFIDDKEVAKDSYEKNLKPGSYKLKAAKEKHHDDQKEVFVNIGETRQIHLDPVPRLGSISVLAVEKSSPANSIKGARIYLDNEDSKKETPAVLELLHGEYELKLEHSRYLDSIKKIDIIEGESKTITFELDTYQGSMLAKKNTWKRNSWLGFTAGALLVGGGFYCNMQANDYFEKYQSTGITAKTLDYKQKTQDFESYRDYCYYAASGAAVYMFYCWIKTSIYGSKTK
jgi:hypothetical protein